MYVVSIRDKSHDVVLYCVQCIRGRESLYALEILDKGLQMVLARHGGASGRETFIDQVCC